MSFDIAERNPPRIHQKSRQFGRVVDGPSQAVALVLAHLNTNGIIIPRPIKISVLPLFARRQMLHNQPRLHREMPRQKANAVATRSAPRRQGPTLERQRMLPRPSRIVLRRMNSNVARPHRTMPFAPHRARRNHGLSHARLPQQLQRRDFAVDRHRPKLALPPIRPRTRRNTSQRPPQRPSPPPRSTRSTGGRLTAAATRQKNTQNHRDQSRHTPDACAHTWRGHP